MINATDESPLMLPTEPTSSMIYKNLVHRRDQLVKFIDGRFGLESELLAANLIDRDQCEIVRNKATCQKQNNKIIDYVLEKTEAETIKFVEALSRNWQLHVVNCLLDVTDTDVRPLSDEDMHRLDANEPFLIEKLDTKDVITSLYSKQCISRMQRDHLDSQPVRRVVGELVSILIRRSFADFKKFIVTLYETDQGHVARKIHNYGDVMPMRCTIVATPGTPQLSASDLQNKESTVLLEFERLLNNATEEEQSRMTEMLEMKKNDLSLVGVRDGSVILFLWCCKLSDLERLRDWLENGKMAEIIESLFNKLLKTSQDNRVTVIIDWSAEEYKKCVNHLSMASAQTTISPQLPSAKIAEKEIEGITPTETTALMDVLEDAWTSLVRRHLRDAPYDCLFHDKVRRRLSSSLAMRPSLMEIALRRLEAHEEREAEFECEESARLNLHTFINWCMKKRSDELMEQNKKTLEKYPDNIAALTFKVKFMMEGGSLANETGLVFDRIKLLSHSNDEANINVFICEAEIARAYHLLGQQFYCETLDRYEKVTKMSDKIVQDCNATVELIDCCHFRIAQTYNRMMSPTYRPVLQLKGINSLEAFRRTSEHLTAVIDGNRSQHVARSMIEIVESYEKCRQGERIEFPYETKLSAFVEDALRKGNDDPYVLEHCGKYYRKHASWDDEEALLHAIAILDRCTDLSKIKHVAWHQKGIIFRSLHYNTKNKSETANKKKVKFRGRQQGRHAIDLQSNSKQYMHKAVFCFRQACDITSRSRCNYLVELAKSLAQLGETEEARKTYYEAESLLTKTDHVDDGDSFYLYSRWAVFVDSQLGRQERMHKSGSDHYTMEDLMTKYRKAIRFALNARSDKKTSKPCFDQLFQCLFKSQGIAVEIELGIIGKVMEAFANHIIPLIELIQNDYQLRADIHTLIQSLTVDLTGCYDNANTVYLYLTALAKAGKLDLNSQEYCQFSLNVAKTMFTHDYSKHPGSFNRVLRDVFRWYTRDAPDGSQASEINSDVRLEDDFDTYVVTCTEDDTKETRFVMDLLQKHLGLFVGRLTPSIMAIDDSKTLGAITRITSAIIVDQRSHKDWTSVETELKRFLGASTATICVASCYEPDERLPEVLAPTDQWPIVTLEMSEPIDELAISLVRSMISSMITSRSKESIGGQT